MINHTEQSTPAVLTCTGNSLNLAHLFRCAGLPHVVTASSAFARMHGLLASQPKLDQHYDLAWTVRCAVVGLLPARKVATVRGEGLIVEFISQLDGKPDPVGIAVGVLTSSTTLHLVLPQEIEASEARLTVLLVEDNLDLASLITRLLDRSGYQVIHAATGEEGLRLAQSELPGVIVLDVDLPGINGYEVCRRLKAEPQTSAIPVIFFSGRVDLPECAAALGAAAWLAKPAAVTELIATIRRLLVG